MKLHPIQNSFEVGELSPRMLGRSDTGPYQKGLALLKNMIVDSRGGIRSRNGTRFGFDFPAQCARLEVFQVDPNVHFNMIFTDLEVTVTSITGLLPALDLVENPYFNESGAGWAVATSGGGSGVNFDVGLCTMVAGVGGGSFAAIREEISIAEGTIEQAIVVNTFGTGKYEVRVGSAPGLSEYLLDTTSLARFEGLFTVGVAGPITVWIEIRAVQSQTVLCTSVHVFDPLSEEVKFDTPWPCDALRELYFVPAPGGKAVYVLHRKYQPQKLTYDIGTNSFQLVPVTFKDPDSLDPLWIAPPEWTGGNWPGVGAVFQGRLWLMSTDEELEWMWGSQSGEYEKFFIKDPANVAADDAIMALPMEHFGGIQWALGTKNLVVGTVNGEYIITGSDGLIRPTDVQILRQSAYGSARVQPQQINDQIMYVSADRRKVRAMAYTDSASNWVSNDLLFLSEHLSLPRIVDVAWAQNPDNILWCSLANGDLLSCTYERNNDIIGWAHHDTQGSFVDVAVGEVFGLSVINLIAQRQPNVFNLETLPPPGLGTPLDSSVRKNDDVPFDTVEGLEHLEGLTCQVVANGAVHPPVVVTGGIAQLKKEYTDVYVGLGFDKEFITLPLDKGSRTGSGASHMKRWARVYIRLLDSAKPVINGNRPPTRKPATPMDTPELPRTEDVSVATLGWDTGAIIHVKQDLPLDLTVLALFGSLGQEDL